MGFSRIEFDSVSHVGVILPNTSVSPLSPRRGGRFVGFSRSEFDSVSHVGAILPNTSVSPLSLRERARVRGALDLAFALALDLLLICFGI